MYFNDVKEEEIKLSWFPSLSHSSQINKILQKQSEQRAGQCQLLLCNRGKSGKAAGQDRKPPGSMQLAEGHEPT